MIRSVFALCLAASVVRAAPSAQAPSAATGPAAIAESRTVHDRASGLPDDDVQTVDTDRDGRIIAVTRRGAVRLEAGRWVAVPARAPRLPAGVRQSARSADGRQVEARADGLFLRTGTGPYYLGLYHGFIKE